MKSFVVIGLTGGIYSAIITAIYLRFRKEKMKGICAVWEQVKWLIWCGAAIFLPLFTMQYVNGYFQLNLSKDERFYVLAIWLVIICGYIGLAGYSAWRKGELKIYGTGGKVIYEGRKRYKIS